MKIGTKTGGGGREGNGEEEEEKREGEQPRVLGSSKRLEASKSRKCRATKRGERKTKQKRGGSGSGKRVRDPETKRKGKNTKGRE